MVQGSTVIYWYICHLSIYLIFSFIQLSQVLSHPLCFPGKSPPLVDTITHSNNKHDKAVHFKGFILHRYKKCSVYIWNIVLYSYGSLSISLTSLHPKVKYVTMSQMKLVILLHSLTRTTFTSTPFSSLIRKYICSDGRTINLVKEF